jgi:hypothetical protein
MDAFQDEFSGRVHGSDRAYWASIMDQMFGVCHTRINWKIPVLYGLDFWGARHIKTLTDVVDSRLSVG